MLASARAFAQRLAASYPRTDILRSFTSSATSVGPPRWYKQVTVTANPEKDDYLIQLDQRTLRTPARHLLAIPSYSLALALAAEWQQQVHLSPSGGHSRRAISVRAIHLKRFERDWLQIQRIQPHTMPLMSLAATALDEPKPREKVIEALVGHLHTDALTCRHDDEQIAAKQMQVHEPIVHWASQLLRAPLLVNNSIFGAQQPVEATAALSAFLEGHSNWELAAIDSLSGSCKSVILGTAIFRGRVSIEEGISLARFEENLQLESWGYVEGGHDIDDADINLRISSASIFTRLLREG